MRSAMRKAALVAVLPLLLAMPGTARAMSPDPAVADFGPVPLNTTKTKDIAITVDAGYRLNGGSLVGEGYSFDWDTCQVGGEFFAGPGSCNLTLSFTPSDLGLADGSLAFGETSITDGTTQKSIIQARAGGVADTIPPTTTGSAISGKSTYSFGTWAHLDVIVTLSATDNAAGSGVAKSEYSLDDGATWLTYTVPFIVSREGDNVLQFRSTDNGGNVESAQTALVRLDKTAPTATASASPAANANGWNNTNVTVSFSGADGLSGIDSCSPDVVLSSEGADQSASGTCTDLAGNRSDAARASGINIDETAPGLTWNGGPTDGATYHFGSVPAAPTCDASDALSGPNGCSVSGYSASVGANTLTATALDKAGNTATETRSYTVLAWTLTGFYNPVDMNDVLNIVKGGSTVPLKFEIFAGPTELTSTSAIASFKTAKVDCGLSGGATDEIEVTSTGGTSLRYDVTGGQFIQNWQTPKTPGVCYRATMTAQDGSNLSAYFKMK